MKKVILKTVFLMSVRLFRTFTLLCFFTGMVLANDGKAQKISEVSISLDVTKGNLITVFKEIEKRSSFIFVYDKSVGESRTTLSLHEKNVTVEKILEIISQQTGLRFRQDNGNNIAVNARGIHEYQSTQPSQPVKGKITDQQTGEPLPGVSIIVKGTAEGTNSDANGDFSLNVSGENATLVFSFIGYAAQEIEVGSQTIINVLLSTNYSTLGEVVVIGYGQQSKAKITGAVSQVKGKELNSYNGSNFALQLAGKTAGVVINDASAQPGSNPQIIIRGIGTLTAGRNPLIVVDGFPLSEGSSLNSVNPPDIESIDILKDPASAAIYGSRAANGVILITTKKGTSEKLHVNVDVYTGVQERADKVEFVDAYQAAQYFTEARDWAYVSKNPGNRSAEDDRATRLAKGASLRELRLNYLQPYLDEQPGLTNTNWFDEVFRKGIIQSYNLSFSGGSDKTNYFVSANYFNQEGIVIENSLRRFSGTVKIDSKISKKLDFGIAVNPSYNVQNYFDNNGNWMNDPIAGLQIMYPFFSPYNADGTLAISQQIIENTPEDGALGENVVAMMKKIKNKRDFFRTFGNSYLSYDLIKGLKFKTMLGADIISNYTDFFNPSDIGQYRGAAPKPATAIEGREFNINYITENTLNYSVDLGNHSIGALAGYTFQKENGSSTTVTGTGISDNNLPNIAGASAFSAAATRYTWTQVSYLGRLQYSFRDTYLFTSTIRRDGSSRFGDSKKWGNFPSLTAGWIASNESFFPKSRVVTFAKLRASWGRAGNNQIGSYSSKALVNSSNYVFGNTLGSGFAATTVSNSNLSWETKTSVNIGVNLGLWNKLDISADYYTSETKDLLLNVPIPEQSGFSSSIQNIGKLKNSGIEFEVSGHDIDLGPVKLSFSGNLATNKNKVLALASGQTQILTGTETSFLTRVGGPVAVLYGYNVTGVYKTEEEINSTPHPIGTLTGDYIVEDLDRDGDIDLNDRKGFGTYNPKFTYGFSGNVSFKNFDLSFAFAGIEGRKIWDRGIALFDESGEAFAMPSKYYFENRYHPVNNPEGFLGQPNMGNFSNNRKTVRASSLFFKDADYLRLRNVQLSYTFPAAWSSKLKLSSARLYATANNLFTITKYKGFNPDGTSVDNAFTNNVLTNGLAFTNYPVARSYTVGVSISF